MARTHVLPLLRKLFSPSSSCPRARLLRSSPPRLEALEDRVTPSVDSGLALQIAGSGFEQANGTVTDGHGSLLSTI